MNYCKRIGVMLLVIIGVISVAFDIWVVAAAIFLGFVLLTSVRVAKAKGLRRGMMQFLKQILLDW
jgi:hypothetical protein